MIRCWLVFVCTFLVTLPSGADAPLTPMDFAWGQELRVRHDQALHELTVPDTIYRHVKRGDLGDLRVFNGAGQVVPHAFRELPPSASEPETRNLPLFMIDAPAAARHNDLIMRVQTRADGAIVDVRSATRTSGGAARARVQVLDASQIKQPIQALDLTWAAPVSGFLTSVNVETSDDLRVWRRARTRAPVASLEQGGHRLEQRRVELGHVSAKYLRLRWPEGGSPQVTHVNAVLVPAEPLPQLAWQHMTVVPDKDEPGALRFDLPAPWRIERLRIVPREQNSVARVEVLSRHDSKQPWRSRGSALIYRMSVDGRTLDSRELALSPGSDREWLIRVANRESAFGDRLPVVEAGYRPAQLVFLTRGAGPFLLAYGSGRAVPADRPLESLLQGLSDRPEARPRAAAARLGSRKTLGGTDALRAPVSPRDWKVMSLWVVLGAGVLLLGWMARRLFRQVSAAPGDGSPPPG